MAQSSVRARSNLSIGRSIPDTIGVNISFTDAQPAEVKMIRDGGFRWIRMDLKWDATELEKGKYDFSAYDRLLAALQSYDIRALFILDYGNPLYDHGGPPRTDEAREAFARWALAAAEHFANRKILWEIYNEPNHALFWPPRPSADEYIKLAMAVGKAFREKLPDEQLIGPATSEIDFSFLAACFKAGLLEYWSAVSIHPYRRTVPETVADDYCRVRQLIDQYAPKTKQIPIISGEWGYSESWRNMTADVQGKMIARSLLTNLGNNIALSIWYDWHDDGEDANQPEHHFGTVGHKSFPGREPIFDPKPAYLAVQTLTRNLGGLEYQKRIDVGNSEDYVLLFTNESRSTIAVWTTGGAHELTVPIAAGQYRMWTHTGESIGAVAADQKGFTLAVTSAPVYVTN